MVETTLHYPSKFHPPKVGTSSMLYARIDEALQALSRMFDDLTLGRDSIFYWNTWLPIL